MAFLRASLRAAIHIGYAPHISMAKVNYLLWESIERHQFVTAFYGVLDASNRTLAYTNAGHNPPLLMDVLHWKHRNVGVIPANGGARRLASHVHVERDHWRTITVM